MLNGLSAITILLRPKAKKLGSRYNYEILCLKRGNISRSGMWTFPGGTYEESDNNLMVTAVRELFEETGVTLFQNPFSNQSISAVLISDWRKNIRNDSKKFANFLQEMGDISVSEFDLHHYCTFSTPSFEKRKYTTLFFLGKFITNNYDHIIADGSETAMLKWLDPLEAMANNASGLMPYLPPQHYIFHELSAFFDIDDAFSSLHTNSPPCGGNSVYSPLNVPHLIDARGFPLMQPVVVDRGDDSDTGTLTLCMPGDIAYRHASSDTPFVCRDAYDKTIDHSDIDRKGGADRHHRIYCTLPMGTGYRLVRNVTCADVVSTSN